MNTHAKYWTTQAQGELNLSGSTTHPSLYMSVSLHNCNRYLCSTVMVKANSRVRCGTRKGGLFGVVALHDRQQTCTHSSVEGAEKLLITNVLSCRLNQMSSPKLSQFIS